MTAQREWYEKDYYKVLGVSKDASDKEITRVYRKLAKAYHPDSNPGSEEKFKEVSAAYDVLGDAAKRKEYDEVRSAGPMAGGFGGFPGGTSTPGGSGEFRAEDLGDLIGGLFNRGRNRSAGPQRGADVETELHLSFHDAATGVTSSVNVSGEAVCSVCGGTGAATGTVPQVCARCNGTGSVSDNQGFFSFSQTCPACRGRGLVVDRACSNCGGAGTEHRNRVVKVRIPAGVEPGQRIRIKGRGAPGKNGGPSGDLYVLVHVGRHELFSRKGVDLTVSVPVTFAEASLGADITVPTLDGSVRLRIPEGTKSGRVFRVKGKGITTTGKNARSGDLLASIEIVVPKDLTAEQRVLIEELAKAIPQSPRETFVSRQG